MDGTARSLHLATASCRMMIICVLDHASKRIDLVGRRAAFVASGDLSHRLKPQAPAGYNPDAHLFDEEVVAAIRSCDPLKDRIDR